MCSSDLPTLLLSQLARRHVTVALTGEGADELFGGYPRYGWEWEVGKYEHYVPRFVARAGSALLSRTGPRRYAKALRLLGQERATRHQAYGTVFDRGLTPRPAVPMKDPVRQLAYTEINSWLPDDLLMKVDKMSMAASLEARCPFLDHVFAEMAFALPTGHKLRRGANK